MPIGESMKGKLLKTVLAFLAIVLAMSVAIAQAPQGQGGGQRGGGAQGGRDRKSVV